MTSLNVYSEAETLFLSQLTARCDADPDVLADYIIALLKHDSNQDEASWKTYMKTELEEFLGAQTEPFVNACFDVIQTKAYMPGAAPATPAEAPMAAEPQPGPSRDTEMTDVSNGLPQPPQQQQQRRPRCRDYHGALSVPCSVANAQRRDTACAARRASTSTATT